MKKAVVQIYIEDGDIPKLDVEKQNKQLIEDSIKDFRGYADLYGADYFLCTDRFYNDPQVHPQNEIFRVLHLNYDYILTVDVDVVVNQWHYNIFEASHPTLLNAAWRPGFDPNINSGVLVWTPEAQEFTKEHLDLAHAETLKNRDQDHLLEIWGHEFHYLDDRWNDYLFRDDGFFHHYKAGLKSKYDRRRYDRGPEWLK